jgi:hypothetical protein
MDLPSDRRLQNRTPYTLTLTDSGLDHGQWTDGGLNPPPNIAPGATVAWQSESGGDIPVIGSVGTGTEGHVTYSIPSTWQPWFQIHPETAFDHTTQRVTALARPPDHVDLFVIGFDNAIWSTGWGLQSLYIYWDNPFVGLNRYHQSVGPGFGISFSGGKGNNTEVVYTLQLDTPVFASNFRPSQNGFPFSNNWPSGTDTYLKLPPFTWWGNGIAIGDASNGLCGGMVFAVRDYFDAGQRPAQVQPSGAGDPVFDYIVRRLFDSFNSPAFGSCDPVPCGGYNVFANVVDFQTQASRSR